MTELVVGSGLVPLLDEQTGRFPDVFAPPSVAADAVAAHDAAEAAERAQEAAEAAENNAAEHEREAGQIVEDATATIPGLISEQVAAQIDPKVAAATQAKADAETARDAAQTARDDALQAKAQAVAAQEAASGSAGAAAAATVTSGEVVGDDLILTRTDERTVNAGSVRGPRGEVTSLGIGTVATTEPGGAATAEITGEAPNQTLNLSLPRGLTGPAGPEGPAGPQGSPGVVQSLTGTTRQITVAGTPAAPVLSIPASPLLTAPEMVAAQPGPVFGPELAPPLASWTGSNGATWNGTAWTLPAGATISTTLAVTSGAMYQVGLTHPSIGQRPDAVQLGSAVQGTSEGANRSVAVTASEIGRAHV